MAVVGNDLEVSLTVETGLDDRATNMRSFAEQALALLLETLG
jgi:hypothetical protein